MSITEELKPLARNYSPISGVPQVPEFAHRCGYMEFHLGDYLEFHPGDYRRIEADPAVSKRTTLRLQTRTGRRSP